MRYFLILILGMFLMIGCTSSRDLSTQNKEDTAANKPLDISKLSIECDWAYPMISTSLIAIANSGLFPTGSSVNQVNLVGNPNYFRIQGDSISVYLPYFGEQQLGRSYNNRDTSIQFDGIPDSFEIKENTKKNRRILKFGFKYKTESYRAQIILYDDNNRSDITVTSSHRSQIRYRGFASELEEEIYN
ncbi:DUF4251 domain-containing protein [Aquimarina sp. 2201CG5-10]|uniref:DUF4251 domain-containing protein n=1 Tax=Aquimarina callyspongiae TaxID=3098150 RepID=UPI002AB4EAAA|nr:DUF4251 domain-containing protein [Aquimarina sp. 2201CG5-10]MDY8136092.1 DUF4251 domain-containing protein [Aquimarina sp. 2201CG5-10]